MRNFSYLLPSHYYIFCWWSHFGNKIPFNRLFSMWKYIYIEFLALKLRCTQYGLCELSGLRECKGNAFREVRYGTQYFSVRIRIVCKGLPKGCGSHAQTSLPIEDLFPKKLVGSALASNSVLVFNTLLESNGSNVKFICQLHDILSFH